MTTMSLRIALLGLLAAKGPSSGYDLAKLFEHSLNHVWNAGHTQIYPELVKMTADGLVSVGSEGPRGRKTYTITDDGTALLRGWLADHEPSIAVRSEMALQAFLLPLLDKAAAIAVVGRIKALYVAKLAGMTCQVPAVEASPFGRHALRLGVAQAEATIAWADETLAALTAS